MKKNQALPFPWKSLSHRLLKYATDDIIMAYGYIINESLSTKPLAILNKPCNPQLYDFAFMNACLAIGAV